MTNNNKSNFCVFQLQILPANIFHTRLPAAPYDAKLSQVIDKGLVKFVPLTLQHFGVS